MSVALNCQKNSSDDSPFVREAIREAVQTTGLPEEAIFPHTDRLRASILSRAQQLKNEYHKETRF
jgi:hypothetical protein